MIRQVSMLHLDIFYRLQYPRLGKDVQKIHLKYDLYEQ